MANINENRKLMVENMKKVKSQLNENKMAMAVKSAAEFSGKHLHFGWDYEREVFNEYKDWDSILNFFKLNLD